MFLYRLVLTFHYFVLLFFKRPLHHTLTRFWSRAKSFKFKGGIRKAIYAGSGFNLTSDWITKWRQVFVSQSPSVMIKDQGMRELLSTLKSKPLYRRFWVDPSKLAFLFFVRLPICHVKLSKYSVYERVYRAMCKHVITEITPSARVFQVHEIT